MKNSTLISMIFGAVVSLMSDPAVYGAPSGVFTYSTNLVAVANATIRNTLPDSNLGPSPYLYAGVEADGLSTSRALVQFDLSAFPTNAVVTGASLTIACFQDPSDSSAVPEVYSLSPLLANWTESEVTWDDRATSLPWTASGAMADAAAPTGFGFFVPEFGSTTQTISLLFTNNSDVPDYGLANDVQDWISGSMPNNGWLLAAASEAASNTEIEFGSRQNSSYSPVLTVVYSVPFQAPVLKVLPPDNSHFRFSFTAVSSHGYLIQYTTNLTGGNSANNWKTMLVLDPPGPGFPPTFEDIIENYTDFGSTPVFFRVGSY